jgi:hypothetical protein
MDTQTHHPGVTGSEPSQTMGVSANTSHNDTQQEHRHQLVHQNAANAATKHMTQDAHLKIVRKISSSNNKEQHAIGCEYIYTVVNCHPITI